MGVIGGFGVAWQIGVGTGDTMTDVANVKEISFPAMGNEVVDITAHDSTSGAREFIASGLKTAAEFEAELVWDDSDSTHIELIAFEASGAAEAMTIADSGTNETLSFSGIVTEIARESPMDGAMMATVKVQVTGAITIS